MNRLAYQYLLINIPVAILLSGCFGGKVPVRSEAQIRAEATLNKGIRAEQKGDFPEAIELLTTSLTISSSIEDVSAQVTALVNLARLHRLQHDLPTAETWINKALTITSVDSRLVSETVYEKALIELAKTNTASSLEWAQKAVSMERGNGELGSRLNLLARIRLMRGEWDHAEGLASEALNANRVSKQPEEEANSLRILGIAARNKKQYAAGLQYLQEALLIDKRIGKSSKIATDLEELSVTAQNAANLKEAAEYLERACQIHRAAGRTSLVRADQAILADMYVTLGETDKAAAAREEASRPALP